MATVNKNFRIKHGLVVEGTTGTINGQNILTETGSDSYILNLIGGETLVKSVSGNLSVDNTGLLTLDEAGLAANLAGGYLYNDGSTLNVDSEGLYDSFIAGGVATTTNISDAIASEVTRANSAYDAAGSAAGVASDLSDHVNSSSAHGVSGNVVGTTDTQTLSNKTFSDAVKVEGNLQLSSTSQVYLSDGTAGGPGSGTIAIKRSSDSGKVALNVNGSDANIATESYVDGLASNYDPAGSAATAESNANDYTDSAITNLNLAGTYDALGAAATALSDANSYTDSEIAALVDSAPALLDTLNELAAAIADNPNYATDVANLVATKADTTYVDSEISSLDTAAQGYATSAENAAKGYADSLATNYDAFGAATTAYDNAVSYTDTQISSVDLAAQGYATAAENNAKGYADGLAVNYDAAGSASVAESNANTYTDNAVNSLIDGTTQFTEVSIGWMSREVAAYSVANSDNQVTAYAWDKNKGASAKFLVRVRNGIHSQASEILITTDNSNNIAITEYAIVTSNGILADITAEYNVVSQQIELKATAVHTGGTEIIIAGTLMSYGD